MAHRDDDQRHHGGDGEEQHVQHQLVDRGRQSEPNGRVEHRVADRGADHAAAPPGAVTRAASSEIASRRSSGVSGENTRSDQSDRRLGHDRRTDQQSHLRSDEACGLDECKHEMRRDGDGEQWQEIDHQAERHPERARQRPLRRAGRQFAASGRAPSG